MRYLGIDYGSKRIGLAIGSDLASEYKTLVAKDFSFYDQAGLKKLIEDLKIIIEEEKIDALVVGLPVKEDGSHSEESTKIKQAMAVVEDELNIAVQFVDETLTTFVARDILESQGLSEKEIDERADRLAASLILQQFLEDASA